MFRWHGKMFLSLIKMFYWIIPMVHVFILVSTVLQQPIKLISWLDNLHVLANVFRKFSSNIFWKSLLQHKHLYSIKSSLKSVYLKMISQSLYLISQRVALSCLCLHLIIWVRSTRLLTRFDNEFTINLK